MLRSWLTIAVGSLLLVGCAESASDNEKEGPADESELIQNKKANTVGNENESVTYTTTKPGESTPQPVNLSLPTTGVNPAHGEPGHDCAIPVGAPLDGSGAKSQPQGLPLGAKPVPNPAAQPNLQTGAPVGALNPAHGAPGHDCAVAVGAPLPAK
ncbi:MAG: hypothetical protein ACI85F_001900 [Bacteroidia bacterium]|jgi:hypothetical protein